MRKNRFSDMHLQWFEGTEEELAAQNAKEMEKWYEVPGTGADAYENVNPYTAGAMENLKGLQGEYGQLSADMRAKMQGAENRMNEMQGKVGQYGDLSQQYMQRAMQAASRGPSGRYDPLAGAKSYDPTQGTNQFMRMAPEFYNLIQNQTGGLEEAQNRMLERQTDRTMDDVSSRFSQMGGLYSPAMAEAAAQGVGAERNKAAVDLARMRAQQEMQRAQLGTQLAGQGLQGLNQAYAREAQMTGAGHQAGLQQELARQQLAARTGLGAAGEAGRMAGTYQQGVGQYGNLAGTYGGLAGQYSGLQGQMAGQAAGLASPEYVRPDMMYNPTGWEDYGPEYLQSSLIEPGTEMALQGIMAAIMSDKRVKEDIRLDSVVSGTKVYRFKYKGQPMEHRGVLAQEVREITIGPDGYFRVFYDRLPREVLWQL